MSGFGRGRYGRERFGRSDLGRNLIVDLWPLEYFDNTLVLDVGETATDNDKDPLLMILKTYAHQVSLRKTDIDNLPSLLDPEIMPLSVIPIWGEMLGLGIDKNDPEFLQRSFLGNASQWLQIKSSKRGYTTRGLASGFTVEVDNFWRISPLYSSLIPLRFQYYLKPKNADQRATSTLHTDMSPGTFAGTPTTEDSTYAKSSYVRIVFSIAQPQDPNVDYNTLIDLVINKINDVVGIHHEMLPPQLLAILDIQVPAITVTMQMNEFTQWQLDALTSFDITAADTVSTDGSGSVTMGVTLT